ncbi:MAG TPA: helix-turn-helix domain-containing protein [Patescibacteria group bacterium]|nr:helix-turn-helix domain-containing protein [Patescibacteria group bacterium]
MITVLIAEDEAKIKEMLAKVLKKEGYVISDSLGHDGSVKIIKKDEGNDSTSLKEKILELEDALLKDKHGVIYKSVMETVEKPLFEHILEITEGNQLKAARILGINRNTMRAKIKKLGIDVRRWKYA